ncbi:hypothetical protein QLX08_010172 [Tetragonisca angustula]
MMQHPNIDKEDGKKLRNARRKLFEDDDDDETVRNSGVEDNIANCIFEEAKKNLENAKQRWNFDFEKEQPLPGRYEWVKLDEHRNEVCHPLETRDGVENLQTMQEDNDVAMEDHTGGTGK